MDKFRIIGGRPLEGRVQISGAKNSALPCMAAALLTPETVTVTGTENLMMAAALADGVTVLNNAAREPEIVDLAELLNKMGARIEGAGLSAIRIEGVDKLVGAEHTIIPDRIETGTFVVAAAITGGQLDIVNCNPLHVTAALDRLEETGVRIE